MARASLKLILGTLIGVWFSPTSLGEGPNKTPEEVVATFANALTSGDEKKIATCFDLSQEEDKAAAEAFQDLARLIQAREQLISAVREKFGEPGVSAAKKYLVLDPAERPNGANGVDPLLQRKTGITKEGDTASVTIDGKKADNILKLKRKGDRWYIAPADDLMVSLALVGLTSFVEFEKLGSARDILQRSRTVDQFSHELIQFQPHRKSDPNFPEIGKELSREPDVSIFRVADKVKETVQNTGPLKVTVGDGSITTSGDTQYSGKRVNLLDPLIAVGKLPITRVKFQSQLPGGKYEITLKADNSKELFDKLRRAYSQAFDLRVTKEKREIPVLVMTRAKDKNAKPLPAAASADSTTIRFGSFEYTGKLRGLTRELEGLLGQVVVDETGSDERTTLKCESRPGHHLEDITKYLEGNGLRLEPATRPIEILDIDVNTKK